MARVYEAYALSVKRPITVVSVRTIALRLPSARRRSLSAFLPRRPSLLVPSARRALAKQTSDGSVGTPHQVAIAAALRLRVVGAVPSSGEALLGGPARGGALAGLLGVVAVEEH